MFKNRSESVHRAVLEGSWAILAPRWPQDGPKSPQNLEHRFLGPPLGGNFGSQNRSKSVSRAIRKVMVFMIDLKIDFWSGLVPTYRHLDPQHLPKMGPSWLQNRCKLECWFESCFWKDVRLIFIVFFTTTWHGRSSTNINKHVVFLAFFNFWLLCCWGDLLLGFDRFFTEFLIEHRPTIDQKIKHISLSDSGT